MINVALILAAGKGNRFGSIIPKQYHKIGNITLLERSIIAFDKIVDYIQVVINQNDISLYNEIAAKYELLPCVYGGDSRQDSVKIGLDNILFLNPENVLIHDAARPFVSQELILQIMQSLKTHQAVIPVIKSVDSVKRIANNKILKSLDRNQICFSQTPQGFNYQIIYEAYQRFSKKITDDVEMLEGFDIDLITLESDPSNIKITYPGDIKMNETRVGIGFDAHKFSIVAQRDYIVIGGIKIPYHKSIEAHSDGDIVLHALTDAILGAIGEGDIGEYFSDQDEKNQNRDSADFVMFAYNLLIARKIKILNVDVVIIAQQPKFSIYKNDIRSNIAKILNVDITRINIKATTTENIGFTGREEGIAAQVIINLAL